MASSRYSAVAAVVTIKVLHPQHYKTPTTTTRRSKVIKRLKLLVMEGAHQMAILALDPRISRIKAISSEHINL